MSLHKLVFLGIALAMPAWLSACVAYEPTPNPPGYYYPAYGYYAPGYYYYPPPAYGSVGVIFGGGGHDHDWHHHR